MKTKSIFSFFKHKTLFLKDLAHKVQRYIRIEKTIPCGYMAVVKIYLL